MAKEFKAVRFANGEAYKWDPMWSGSVERGEAVQLSGAEAVDAVAAYQRSKLLEMLQPGSRIRAVCTYRSSSGMSHRFRVYAAATDPNGKPYVADITGRVAELVGFRLHNDEIQMGGCGYSKSFQIGYSLGQALWPNGTPEVHGTRNGEPDRDGGYAIMVD